MNYFLGLDGGQSSTVALIADETGKVVGWGRGGPCNHVAASEAKTKFAAAMQETLNSACQLAELHSVEFEAACLGFSGGAAGKEAYCREFIQSRAFKITHDAEIALTGATAGQPGIIVIAGTGSIAFGQNQSGKQVRAGGWGYIFGDEGGAFDIVRQALRAALSMEEGWGPATALHRNLLRHTGQPGANALLHDWYNKFDRREIAKLASLVDATADEGDAVARDLLIRAGHDLCDLVSHVHQSLFQPGETVPVSYIGGVFQSLFLANSLRQSVSHTLGCDVLPPILPPAAGALLEAFRMAGNPAQLSGIPSIKS